MINDIRQAQVVTLSSKDSKQPRSVIPGTALLTVGDVGGWLTEAGGILQYLLVFAFAAVPWVEILVVIPIAIGVGLHPVLVGIVAFAGNVVSLYGLVLFYGRLAGWWGRRESDSTDEQSRRSRWARRIWDRYGLPGLALAAPVLTGVHLAAVIALAAGSRPRAVGWWMSVGIAVWTLVLVAGSAAGISFIEGT